MNSTAMAEEQVPAAEIKHYDSDTETYEYRSSGFTVQEHISVEVKLNLADIIKARVAEGEVSRENSFNFSITRVPAMVRRDKEVYFEPSVVSIGPYHRDNPKFKDMEKVKWQQLIDVFKRRKDIQVEDCIKELRSLEREARSCYLEEIKLSSDEFVEMMLLDGIFILEFFLKISKNIYNDKSLTQHVSFHSRTTTFILSDLLLLENQIPFLVLQNLFNLVGGRVNETGLFVFLTDLYRFSTLAIKEDPAACFLPSEKIHHLLHLIYHCHLHVNPENLHVVKQPSLSPFRAEERSEAETKMSCSSRLSSLFRHFSCWQPDEADEREYEVQRIPCATQLTEAGISFRKKKAPKTIVDITFCKGVLEIPPINVDDLSKVYLMNFLAYEQNSAEHSKPLSCYVVFMDHLINTAEDVQILQQSGVLMSGINCEEETAKYFNMLGDYVNAGRNDLHVVVGEVNRYCKQISHKWRAKLVRDYFGNPWAILSLIAAVVLLILTLVQTFYSVYGYYVPN